MGHLSDVGRQLLETGDRQLVEAAGEGQVLGHRIWLEAEAAASSPEVLGTEPAGEELDGDA